MIPAASLQPISVRTIKLERAEHANAVLRAVSDHGRRFFYHAASDRVARFEVDARGAVWFVDHYTDQRVYVTYPGRWHGFTGGGTLRSMVEALRDYIRTGKAIHPGHFGPWNADIVNGGDLWGYGVEAMTRVRAVLSDNAAVGPRAVRLV